MTVLVTGGSGFLGSAIVRGLLARSATVRSLARSPAPELETLGVEVVRGDIADRHAVDRALAGCELVFHVAAKAGMWGAYAAYATSNIEGTRHVLDACRRHGVRRLVYTSTPSVVHRGVDIEGGDERLPYATRFDSPYPATKAIAEQMVLAANDAGLATVALRPHLLWGPGDTQLVPRILERARRGQLRLVDRGRAVVDVTYVDNAAHAHLLAADRLHPGSLVAGRAYFIAQGRPLPVRDLLGRILAAAGLPPATASVPFAVAYAAGATAEVVWRLLGREAEPPMTRFLARQLATSHWFDLTAARCDLGYEPPVSLEEGLARLARHLAGPGVSTNP
ncbi:MAG: NAD-dependent epimerase/dehydratase family protein [Actinomycetota bacterium]|nr:NAD-dependent epimerase/dehydratase family protein [Actinomycetota bacterium]